VGIDTDGYKIVLVLHILCAIVGFGAVMLNAVYGAEVRKRQGAEGLAVLEANMRVSKIGEYFIYAVFILGFALVGMSDKAWKFSQTWVWLAVLLYIVAIAISHAVMQPSTKRMRDLMAELVNAGPPPAGAAPGGPPPQVVEMQAIGKRLATFGPVLNIMLVVILGLMVFKPGL
jgi:hypothetical protein